MSKPVITKQQFVDLVNERLPSHPLFRQGMRIFLIPVGVSPLEAGGIDVEPADAYGVVKEVVDQVLADNDVLGTPPVVRGHP